PHRRLLRARRERPRDRCTAEHRELAPLHHSITSSARATSVVLLCRKRARSGHRHGSYSITLSARTMSGGGMPSPSALAVLRLMTSRSLLNGRRAVEGTE